MSLSTCDLIVTQIPTPAMPKSGSIAYYAERCRKLFEELHEELQRSATGKELSPESLLGESRRFSIWARNIVALQDARLPSSLEYRIRNDDAAIKAVKSALEYLAESLEIGQSTKIAPIRSSIPKTLQNSVINCHRQERERDL